MGTSELLETKDPSTVSICNVLIVNKLHILGRDKVA